MRILLASTLVAVGLSSCVAAPPVVERNDYVTPTELNERPDFFDGKTVIVHGFLLIDVEQRFIVQDRQTYENWTGDGSKCITTTNDQLLWSIRRKFAKRMVEVRGVFRKDALPRDAVMLGACNITGIEVDPSFEPRLL